MNVCAYWCLCYTYIYMYAYVCQWDANSIGNIYIHIHTYEYMYNIVYDTIVKHKICMFWYDFFWYVRIFSRATKRFSNRPGKWHVSEMLMP